MDTQQQQPDADAFRKTCVAISAALRKELVRSLWHSANEEPRGETVLCRCLNINPFHPAKYSYHVCNWAVEKAAANSSYGGDELRAFRSSYWAARAAVRRILCWCYLSDILPDGEEEEGQTPSQGDR